MQTMIGKARVPTGDQNPTYGSMNGRLDPSTRIPCTASENDGFAGHELECSLWCALKGRREDENDAKEARKAKVAGTGLATHSVAGGLVHAATYYRPRQIRAKNS